jgi:hypothetical protein
MRLRVMEGDSMEGSIEYLLPPTPDELPDGEGHAKWADAEFAVRASYRVGNSMGQGGVRMIGEM